MTSTQRFRLTGRSAARFVLATEGGVDRFTATIENATIADVQHWYTTLLAPRPGAMSRLGS